MPWFTWTKEPVFSTEQADRLNSPEFKGQDAKREVLFLESRLSQQSLYNEKPCLLDRYLWTGLAYAKAFSPSIYNFAEALYTNHNIFKKPDLYIFMETPLEKCYDREPALKKEPGRLERIRQAYRDTESLIDSPIEYIDGNLDPDACVNAAFDIIFKHFPDQKDYDAEIIDNICKHYLDQRNVV
jgi:thymidylate kinase